MIEQLFLMESMKREKSKDKRETSSGRSKPNRIIISDSESDDGVLTSPVQSHPPPIISRIDQEISIISSSPTPKPSPDIPYMDVGILFASNATSHVDANLYFHISNYDGHSWKEEQISIDGFPDIDSKPYASGGMRDCYVASLDINSTRYEFGKGKVVVKTANRLVDQEDDAENFYMTVEESTKINKVDVQIAHILSVMISRFKSVCRARNIDMVWIGTIFTSIPIVIKNDLEHEGGRASCLVDQFFEGLFLKYNSTEDWKFSRESYDAAVVENTTKRQESERSYEEHLIMFKIAEAFSHWTYVATNGEQLICDIQGISYIFNNSRCF
jgi:hypothetical protein